VALVDVSIIVVSYNTESLLARFFSSLHDAIAASPKITFEMIVIDNASTDRSAETIKNLAPKATLVVNAENVGFGRANNQALSLASGRFILLLNTDAFIISGRVEDAVAYLEAHSSMGILGAKLVGEDNLLQPSCRFFPSPLSIFYARFALHRAFPKLPKIDDLHWDHATVRICDWVPGCFYLVKKAVIDKVGLFDPRYFLYYEEVDHCRQTRKAGWDIAYFPFISVIHLGGESAKSSGALNSVSKQLTALQVESELLYMRKQYGLFGLVGHMLLLLLAIAIGILKAGVRAVRSNSASQSGEQARVLIAEWRLIVLVLGRTRFGSRPTR
jgi:N-acetylglucosaminyl-diphospho-decaprenol L-rhamnosyltransferase